MFSYYYLHTTRGVSIVELTGSSVGRVKNCENVIKLEKVPFFKSLKIFFSE